MPWWCGCGFILVDGSGAGADMPITHYRRMAQKRTEAALEEFLAEQAPVLQCLHDQVATDGIDPQCHVGK